MSQTGIITAASEKYANSLFCLLGSLNCNWPNHPPVVIYDLGLSDTSKRVLWKAKIEIRQIPPFCEHWRAHYTWKIWCLKHSEFEVTIWMDAGICILNPMDEIIDSVKKNGYFLMPNYQFLDYEASEQTCRACGVEYDFRLGKGSIAGTFIGFAKNTKYADLIDEAYQIALNENNIKAYSSKNKHDQSIISILTYKYYPNPSLADGIKYLGWESPKMILNQSVWLQRRRILKEDIKIFKRNLLTGKHSHVPKDPILDISLPRKIFRKLILESKSIGRHILKVNRANGIR